MVFTIVPLVSSSLSAQTNVPPRPPLTRAHVGRLQPHRDRIVVRLEGLRVGVVEPDRDKETGGGLSPSGDR
jgi:hypothetical protein